MNHWRPRGTDLGLLLALGILAYANSFAGVFYFDDQAVLFDDPRLQSLSTFGLSEQSSFDSASGSIGITRRGK